MHGSFRTAGRAHASPRAPLLRLQSGEQGHEVVIASFGPTSWNHFYPPPPSRNISKRAMYYSGKKRAPSCPFACLYRCIPCTSRRSATLAHRGRPARKTGRVLPTFARQVLTAQRWMRTGPPASPVRRERGRRTGNSGKTIVLLFQIGGGFLRGSIKSPRQPCVRRARGNSYDLVTHPACAMKRFRSWSSHALCAT